MADMQQKGFVNEGTYGNDNKGVSREQFFGFYDLGRELIGGADSFEDYQANINAARKNMHQAVSDLRREQLGTDKYNDATVALDAVFDAYDSKEVFDALKSNGITDDMGSASDVNKVVKEAVSSSVDLSTVREITDKMHDNRIIELGQRPEPPVESPLYFDPHTVEATPSFQEAIRDEEFSEQRPSEAELNGQHPEYPMDSQISYHEPHTAEGLTMQSVTEDLEAAGVNLHVNPVHEQSPKSSVKELKDAFGAYDDVEVVVRSKKENPLQAYGRMFGETVNADEYRAREIIKENGWKDTPITNAFAVTQAVFTNGMKRLGQAFTGKAGFGMLDPNKSIDRETGEFVDRGRLAETVLQAPEEVAEDISMERM